ncbi:hypothetical protein M0804_002094 [Polistes exclamans]|nr:hypothetical protein M0804_002094 [Polistes exclamans]
MGEKDAAAAAVADDDDDDEESVFLGLVVSVLYARVSGSDLIKHNSNHMVEGMMVRNNNIVESFVRDTNDERAYFSQHCLPCYFSSSYSLSPTVSMILDSIRYQYAFRKHYLMILSQFRVIRNWIRLFNRFRVIVQCLMVCIALINAHRIEMESKIRGEFQWAPAVFVPGKPFSGEGWKRKEELVGWCCLTAYTTMNCVASDSGWNR